MTQTNALPAVADWTNIDDVIGLLEWLNQQAEPGEEATHALPATNYGIEADNTDLRVIAGLLSIYQQRQDHAAAQQLLINIIQNSDEGWENLALLVEQLEKHEQALIQQNEEKLDLLVTEQLKLAENKLDRLTATFPYFASRLTADQDHEVVFAVEIKEVQSSRVSPDLPSACGNMLITFAHAANHLADRYGLGLDLRFAWRFISERQTLSIALIVQLGGLADSNSAESAAKELWDTVNRALPFKASVFSYMPVTDPQRLDWICRTEEISHAFAITRQTYQFEYEGRSIYGINPLGMGQENRHDLLNEMLRQPGMCVLDVQIVPTRWQREEREIVREMLNIQLSNPTNTPPKPIVTLLEHLDDSRYIRALESYLRILDREKMFEVRVTMASTSAMSATSLPMVAALNLFGTSHYEIRAANLPEELKAAQQLLQLKDTDWPRHSAPKGLERLLHLWTPEEALAAMILPVPSNIGLPGMAVQQIKSTEVPPDLPDVGVIMGDTYDSTLNRMQEIYSGSKERARHTYIVGRTGTGKTTLLENMVLQDIYAGRGVGVIDPHGDLIESILTRIPPARARDVVLFDPASAERPIGLNILDVTGDFEKNMVISEFLGLLYSIYDPGRTGIIGPRFEQAVRNAMQVAMKVEGSTLVDVMRLLSNSHYLKKCLAFVKDPLVLAYYSDILDGQSDFHKSEVLDYITSKFGRFTSDTAIRNVIGQSKTTLDFGEIMDQGKILLVNLSKGRIGQENSSFLGLLLLPRILISVFSRAKQDDSQRKPFYLYVDEFQNFTTPMLTTMLSEGRKYGLSLILANQFISQLSDSVRDSVFGNVGTLGVFQVGVKDAHLLEQEMYPIFNLDDLVNFPAYHMAMKMPLGGASGRPFMVKTRPSILKKDPEMAKALYDYTLSRYGRSMDVINAEIRHRFDTDPKPRQD